MTFETAP